MQAFINYIYNFIVSISTAIYNAFSGNSQSLDSYLEWYNKQIFNGTLINIGLTWRELFLYLFTWFLVIFFICYFVKLVFKVIGLICLR